MYEKLHNSTHRRRQTTSADTARRSGEETSETDVPRLCTFCYIETRRTCVKDHRRGASSWPEGCVSAATSYSLF